MTDWTDDLVDEGPEIDYDRPVTFRDVDYLLRKMDATMMMVLRMAEMLGLDWEAIQDGAYAGD